MAITRLGYPGFSEGGLRGTAPLETTGCFINITQELEHIQDQIWSRGVVTLEYIVGCFISKY